MPNQLSKSKRRQSLAEHESVLAALSAIAETEQTTVMALLREAARNLIKRRASESTSLKSLKDAAWAKAPAMPKRFKTAAEVARFKREQREFDQALLDMGLATPQAVQERNALVSNGQSIRLINFAQAHRDAAV